jgi:hypothetical protein
MRKTAGLAPYVASASKFDGRLSRQIGSPRILRTTKEKLAALYAGGKHRGTDGQLHEVDTQVRVGQEQSEIYRGPARTPSVRVFCEGRARFWFLDALHPRFDAARRYDGALLSIRASMIDYSHARSGRSNAKIRTAGHVYLLRPLCPRRAQELGDTPLADYSTGKIPRQ